MTFIFLAFLCGFLACLGLGMALRYILGLQSPEKALLASEKWLLAELDTRLLRLKHDTESSIQKLAAQVDKASAPIPMNPFYVADKDADISKRHIPEFDDYKMSRGAGGI